MKSQGPSGQTSEVKRGLKGGLCHAAVVSITKERQFLFIPRAFHLAKQEAFTWSSLGKWLNAGQARRRRGRIPITADFRNDLDKEGVEAKSQSWAGQS